MEKQQHNNSDCSLDIYDEQFRTDEDSSAPTRHRTSSDGSQGMRSSQRSYQSKSASYNKALKRRETAVNRMNNGVLASRKPAKRSNSNSIDSLLSASDSALEDHRFLFSLRSSELSSRSLNSFHSSQNQEQQQHFEVSNDGHMDKNGSDENNNAGKSQIQELSIFARCCAGWQYMVCSPMKRYKKRSSLIATQENQYFIPPPEENTTFIESIIYIMNGYGQDFIVWIYQASFFSVLVVSLTAYYALVLSFAAVLVAMERLSDGRCNIVSDTFMSTDSMFELAFELSWSTFTTVGYGAVAPSGEDCYPLRVLCSLFAFLGLLFNSLSAAIFFSKLERVLTKASVTFSSCICLQFSTTDAERGAEGGAERGARRSLENYRKMGFSLRSIDQGSAVPYPYLEFRIVNDHANHKSRAVRNATCAAMVSLSGRHAEIISNELRSSSDLYKEVVTRSSSVDDEKGKGRGSSSTDTNNNVSLKIGGKKRTGLFRSSFKGNSSDDVGGLDQDENDELTSIQDEAVLQPTRRRRNPARSKRLDAIGLTESISATAIIVQENDHGQGQHATPEGRVYFPLKLEPSTNAYMSKVWYVRHYLDAKSPLLSFNVREKLKRDGCWDPELDTYQDMISSLADFHKISVTFKGTSSASNSLLFTQKLCKYFWVIISMIFIAYDIGSNQLILFYLLQIQWKMSTLDGVSDRYFLRRKAGNGYRSVYEGNRAPCLLMTWTVMLMD